MRVYTRDVDYINGAIRLYTYIYCACTSHQLSCFRSIDWSVLLAVLAVMAVRGGSVIEGSGSTSNIQ